MDKKLFDLIKAEKKRQEQTLMLIPSENYAFASVRKAVGSGLIHKYAEGYPGRRYYQGQKYIDQIENLAVSRAQKLFAVPFVNVQPYSGSPANTAVFFALLKPGDPILGLKLSHGGHLTHGHPKITFSGNFYNSIQYGVDQNGYIDYEQVARLAQKYRPKLIIAGTTAYPRVLDWVKFAQIADSVNAYLMADISHIVGLVIAGVHPSPVKYAHVITTTTHKTLRGPRGAMILVTHKGIDKDPNLPIKINRAVFPGLQGGPHINTIAAIAAALYEACLARFKIYGQQIVSNAQALARSLAERQFQLVSGGTDNHLLLINLGNKGIGGKQAALTLEHAGIIVNKNTVPNDPRPPADPSGIRLGTPAVTARGLKEKEMAQIAAWIEEALKCRQKSSCLANIRQQVGKFMDKYPIL